MSNIKQEVRLFYDQVGWQLVGEQVYQNARYEDLRPVAREYIRKCHSRVNRHIKTHGDYLLDVGSGPVQYPDYLEYSRNYRYRVCADISFTALIEARKRIGEHGLYVVVDVANLPFVLEIFDGLVSLHTIHHLPEAEHLQAFEELYRVLAPKSNAVVVNGWERSLLMNIANPLIRLANLLRYLLGQLSGNKYSPSGEEIPKKRHPAKSKKAFKMESGKGTHTEKHDAEWIRNTVGSKMDIDILVWRSITVRFMRALIHPHLGGRIWLRLLYWLEERYPRFFGEKGKYPLLVIHKSEGGDH